MKAQEFILTHKQNAYLGFSTEEPDKLIMEQEILISFAKLHVEAALKAASENATLDLQDMDEEKWLLNIRPNSSERVNTESILTAYPLENIK